MQDNFIKVSKILWCELSNRRQIQLILMFVLMIISAVLEVVNLGAVLPFLGILSSPDTVFTHPMMQQSINYFQIETPEQLILPLTFLFISVVLISGMIRVLYLYVSTRLSIAIGSEFSLKIYKNILNQPYETHASRNSSEIIDGVVNKANVSISSAVLNSLSLVSSIVISLAILGTILIVDTGIAIKTFLAFGIIYACILYFTRKHVSKNSKLVADESIRTIKLLQEGLGGIRDIILDGNHYYYSELYSKANTSLRRAQGTIKIIGGMPRYLLETLGMVMMALLVFMLSKADGNIAASLPFLGLIALSMQRLLPTIQTGYSTFTALKGSQYSILGILGFLQCKSNSNNINRSNIHPIQFNKRISLENIYYGYSKGSHPVINGLNLNIIKGSCIGFIGITGSGKSTLIDIIMGLLEPTKGAIKIDDVPLTTDNLQNWQTRIAHVPQHIFLADSSIEENIAFGIHKNKINRKRVREAAEQAQLLDYISSLPHQFNTIVGENGVRLSGGQRQRIGIARALYKKFDIIVLDEATSSLDNKTESSIIKAIESLEAEVTILMIAHRVTTLKNCDQIIELSKGKIKEIKKYDYLQNNY
jgi:ATP-binding cassette, subfamily B, bacterial PglK